MRSKSAFCRFSNLGNWVLQHAVKSEFLVLMPWLFTRDYGKQNISSGLLHFLITSTQKLLMNFKEFSRKILTCTKKNFLDFKTVFYAEK
jgi:hypothetical protein